MCLNRSAADIGGGRSGISWLPGNLGGEKKRGRTTQGGYCREKFRMSVMAFREKIAGANIEKEAGK